MAHFITQSTNDVFDNRTYRTMYYVTQYS